MPAPQSQNFNSLTGTLGSGSVTFGGLTFYSNDPNAVISVTPDNRLSFGTGAGSHVAGFKSADGANFNMSGGNGMGSLSIYSTGYYGVELLRDGVVIFGSAIEPAEPSFFALENISTNFDELRFTYSDRDLVIDDLNFSPPERSGNEAPVIGGLAGEVAAFVEGGGPAFLDVGANARLLDDLSDELDGASLRVAITSAFTIGEDFLQISTGGSVGLSDSLQIGSSISVGGLVVATVTANIFGGDLLIAFNGAADAGHVATIMRALTYTNTDLRDPGPGNRSIETTFTDPDGGVATVTSFVAVVATPDPPLAVDDILVVTRGARPIFDNALLTRNDVDPFGPVSVERLGAAQSGSITLVSGGTRFAYAAPSSAGIIDDHFSYFATSGDGAAPADVHVRILNATGGADRLAVDDRLRTQTYAPANPEDDAPSLSAWLEGLGGDDTITGGLGRDTLFGGSGRDLINGFGGADEMRGGAGDDIVYVDDANDMVREAVGEGVDIVFTTVDFGLGSGQEIETLAAGSGMTTGLRLTGNERANTIRGGSGEDALNGRAGGDRMIGGAGSDSYQVDAAGDVVVEAAGGGYDWVVSAIDFVLPDHVERLTLSGAAVAGTGNMLGNRIAGNGGANLLSGGGGEDMLTGELGADTLRGGAGQDDLGGGAGADVFRFDDGEFGGTTASTADRILDFVQGADIIDLSLVDASEAAAGDQSFTLIGTAAFTATGQLRFEQSGGATYVSGNNDGDLDADFVIRVDGLHNLLEADFVF